MTSTSDLASLLRHDAARMRSARPDRVDMQRDANRLDHVADWLDTQGELPEERSAWPCVLCEAEPGDDCFDGEPDRFHYQRGFTSGRDEPTDTCRPTFQQGPGRTYRPSCTGCDWRGDIVQSESLAVELSHDHSFPEWRTLPNVPNAPHFSGGGNSKTDKAAMAKWLTVVNSIMPAGWLERGGPIKTHRGGYPAGARHVPGRAPGGGYDMCGSIDDFALVLGVIEGNHLKDFLPDADKTAAKKRLRDRPGSWGRANSVGLIRSDRDPLSWSQFFQIIERGCGDGRRARYDAAYEKWNEWVEADRSFKDRSDPEAVEAHRHRHLEVANELRKSAHAIVESGAEQSKQTEIGDTFALF